MIYSSRLRSRCRSHRPRRLRLAPDVACQHEDGYTDGTACVWTDPDTGTEYWVDSSNYWVDGITPAGAADLTWCPRDEVWSRVWDPCPVS